MADVAEQPIAAPDAPVVAPDDLSLADHEAAYGAVPQALAGDERTEFEEKREKIRHRAKSQAAGPDDVKAIQEWSAKVKAAEDAAGIARNDGESERVYRLRVRAELAEAASRRPVAQSLSQSAESAAPAVPRQEPPRQAQPAQLQPTRPEPSEDDIGTKYPAYRDFTRDQALWVWEQQEQQRQYQNQQQAAQQSEQQAWQSAHATFGTRAQQFAATHPDYDTKLNGVIQQHGGMLPIPDAAYQAIIRSDNGPAFVYHLATHPDQLAEVIAMYRGEPPTPTNVALATSWLTSRAQAVVTGLAVPPSRPSVPPPPNPVRTGPMKTGDELPGDDSSLAEHEKAFKPRRR